MRYLDAPDRTLRGYAAWASGQLGASQAAVKLEKIKNDTDSIPFHEDGELKETVDDSGKSTRVVKEIDGEKFNEFWFRLLTAR